jgi:hypothetical protein
LGYKSRAQNITTHSELEIRYNNMKVLIILLLINFAFGWPDPVYFGEEFKNAKPIEEHPAYKEVIDKLYPNKPINRKGGRVLNGIPATFGQFPHQAFLNMYSPSAGGWYLCGGSFIKYNFVLTVKKY